MQVWNLPYVQDIPVASPAWGVAVVTRGAQSKPGDNSPKTISAPTGRSDLDLQRSDFFSCHDSQNKEPMTGSLPWAGRCGAFSVSESTVERVREYRESLIGNKVDFDERYLI